MPKTKVLVALSGGVDSSVAAALAQDAGHDVVGATLRLTDSAFANEAVDSAQSVAAALKIKHHVIDLKSEFHAQVVLPFASEYAKGRTPNPCVACNPKIKFGLLMNRMADFGCSVFATGHYARVIEKDGVYKLLKGLDSTKDQSYFLAMLRQEQLRKIVFSLGQMTKDSIREIAEKKNLPVAHRPESQDICFLPAGDYSDLIEQILGNKTPGPGDIVDMQGSVLGRHQGYHKLTVGQRKGLGNLGPRARYIVRIEADSGRVVVGENDDLFSSGLRCESFHWIAGRPPRGEIRGALRVRYRHAGQDATARIDGKSVEFTFNKPVRAVTPGQTAVFYCGEEVLGGGWIDRAL